jgi:A/G-specific adenine glycosylase
VTERRSGGTPAALDAPSGPDVPHADALVAALAGWAQRVRRDLPWRATRDPWAILVSEAMLQQTQVSRVVPAYGAFLARFPTPAAAAAAPLGAVLEAWSGLGYYRRARDLHRAAVAIVRDHDGRVPGDLAALVALPGVGAYTARAVLVFAHEQDHGVVDTNAARVLARAAAGARLTAAVAQRLADALVPPGDAWAWNQGMLDLGATVCTARTPRCEVCPLAAADACAWWSRGRPAPDPAVGSAGTSTRQAPFEGSDRQGRGRLLAAIVAAPVRLRDLPAVMGWPDDPPRAARVAEAMVAEGLAVRDGDRLMTPP